MIFVRIIGHASCKDRRVLAGPRKIFEIFRSTSCCKCIEIVSPTITALYCVVLRLFGLGFLRVAGLEGREGERSARGP